MVFNPKLLKIDPKVRIFKTWKKFWKPWKKFEKTIGNPDLIKTAMYFSQIFKTIWMKVFVLTIYY